MMSEGFRLGWRILISVILGWAAGLWWGGLWVALQGDDRRAALVTWMHGAWPWWAGAAILLCMAFLVIRGRQLRVFSRELIRDAATAAAFTVAAAGPLWGSLLLSRWEVREAGWIGLGLGLLSVLPALSAARRASWTWEYRRGGWRVGYDDAFLYAWGPRRDVRLRLTDVIWIYHDRAGLVLRSGRRTVEVGDDRDLFDKLCHACPSALAGWDPALARLFAWSFPSQRRKAIAALRQSPNVAETIKGLTVGVELRQWLLAVPLALLLVGGMPVLLWHRLVRSGPPLPVVPTEQPAPHPAGDTTLESVPAHAWVTVDGKKVGRTPYVLTGHEQDIFDVTLELGGQSVHHFIVLAAGHHTDRYALAPSPPSVAIRPPAPRPTPAPAAPHATVTLEPQAAPSPEADISSVEALAASLTAGLSSPKDKAKALFDWEATHIAYDVDAFYDGQTRLDSGPTVTLMRRRAVCGGYARLYEALCQAAGLEVAFIPGNGRGIEDLRPGQKFINHAWNAVRLDGGWRLVDVTWGAGYIQDHAFVPHLEPFYFCTPPEQFIYTHFPREAKWQQLSTPYTQAAYSALPLLRPKFFLQGLGLIEPTQGQVQAESQYVLRFAVPDNVMLIGRVEDGHEVHKDWLFAQRAGAGWEVRCIFPQPGAYRVRLYAGPQVEGQTSFDEVASFQVRATLGDPSASLPLQYGDFAFDHAFLTEPMAGRLVANRSQSFRVTVPGATSVNVVCAGHWHPLQQQGDTWSGEVELTVGQVMVVPVYPGEQQAHRSILRYDAQ
ncbi:MAG TPA: transglutaminase domain-containing protein [Candidatus Xenobia bacterium]|jgi:hypothetical protein